MPEPVDGMIVDSGATTTLQPTTVVEVSHPHMQSQFSGRDASFVMAPGYVSDMQAEVKQFNIITDDSPMIASVTLDNVLPLPVDRSLSAIPAFVSFTPNQSTDATSLLRSNTNGVQADMQMPLPATNGQVGTISESTADSGTKNEVQHSNGLICCRNG